MPLEATAEELRHRNAAESRHVALARGYETEVDFDAMFAAATPMPKRHKWGPDTFSGSFVSCLRVAICMCCGLERHRQYNYGDHRTIFYRPATRQWFANPDPARSAKTPPCEVLSKKTGQGRNVRT